MAYYLLTHFTINDPETFQHYVTAAMPVTQSFGGRFLAVTGVGMGDFDVIEGTPQHQATALVEFESEESLKRLYFSEQYQTVMGIRMDSTDGWTIGLPGIESPPTQ